MQHSLRKLQHLHGQVKSGSNPIAVRECVISTRKYYDLVSVNKCTMSRAKHPCVTTECKCYDLTNLPVGDFLERLSQAISIGRILVGRFGVPFGLWASTFGRPDRRTRAEAAGTGAEARHRLAGARERGSIDGPTTYYLCVYNLIGYVFKVLVLFLLL